MESDSHTGPKAESSWLDELPRGFEIHKRENGELYIDLGEKGLPSAPERSLGPITPEAMREQVRRAANLLPGGLRGIGLAERHVAAVIAGKEKPSPDLLGLLGLEPEGEGYASVDEREPDAPAWPDGRPLTPEDTAELVECVREALERGRTPGRYEFSDYGDLSGALCDVLETAGVEPVDVSEDFGLAFLAGAAWAERRARESAAD